MDTKQITQYCMPLSFGNYRGSYRNAKNKVRITVRHAIAACLFTIIFHIVIAGIGVCLPVITAGVLVLLTDLVRLPILNQYTSSGT